MNSSKIEFSLLLGNAGYFTRVWMKGFDECRVYYEHKRKRNAQEKSKQKEEILDMLSDQMSIDENRAYQLDYSYILDAYWYSSIEQLVFYIFIFISSWMIIFHFIQMFSIVNKN